MAYDLRGQKSGFLTVIDRVVGFDGGGWECECVCGKKIVVQTCRLVGTARNNYGFPKYQRSCGCMKYKPKTKGEMYILDSGDHVQYAGKRKKRLKG